MPAKPAKEEIVDEIELRADDFSTTAASTATGGGGTGTDNDVLVTREGLKKLQEELDYLRNTRRKEVASRLKEAISYGDLSENSEYEEAKNEQAFIEGRIIELEHKIKHAKIIKGHHTKSVQIGSVVTLKKVGGKEEEVYTIVGTTEADPFENKISNDSPIGISLMDKIVGEKVTVEAPFGTARYEIVGLN